MAWGVSGTLVNATNYVPIYQDHVQAALIFQKKFSSSAFFRGELGARIDFLLFVGFPDDFSQHDLAPLPQ
jgi:hypothetical protein